MTRAGCASSARHRRPRALPATCWPPPPARGRGTEVGLHDDEGASGTTCSHSQARMTSATTSSTGRLEVDRITTRLFDISRHSSLSQYYMRDHDSESSAAGRGWPGRFPSARPSANSERPELRRRAQGGQAKVARGQRETPRTRARGRGDPESRSLIQSDVSAQGCGSNSEPDRSAILGRDQLACLEGANVVGSLTTTAKQGIKQQPYGRARAPCFAGRSAGGSRAGTAGGDHIRRWPQHQGDTAGAGHLETWHAPATFFLQGNQWKNIPRWSAGSPGPGTR